MIPRSAAEHQNVNSRAADEIFAEHGPRSARSGFEIEGDPGYLLSVMDYGNYWNPIYWRESSVIQSLEHQFNEWLGKDETGGLDIW